MSGLSECENITVDGNVLRLYFGPLGVVDGVGWDIIGIRGIMNSDAFIRYPYTFFKTKLLLKSHLLYAGVFLKMQEKTRTLARS